MNIETVIYFAEVLPSINSAIGIILGLSFIIGFIGIFVIKNIIEDCHNLKDADEWYTETKKTYLLGIKIWIALLFLCSVIPSERTIYLMLGANYLKNSTLPSKVEMAIEKKIDSYLAAEKVIKK